MSMLSMGSAGHGELQSMWGPARSQQQQHDQAVPMDTAATARPAVVRSALMNQPPQRRAHMLLQEMAGLANRLVELAVVSATKSWQPGHMKVSIPPFLAGAILPPEGQAAVTSKEVQALLENHQNLLYEAVSELQELQDIEQEKQQIAEEINTKDVVVRAFAKRVRDAHQVLEDALEEYADLKKGKHRKSVPVAELVSYAHRISYTTFAPPDYGAGETILRGALPPAPQEENMRASQLYHVQVSDLGFTSAFAPPPAPEALEEAEPPKAEPIMPAGWRPGMPVQLPPMAELPPMPAGWKIGDPIPLPPLPGMPMEGLPPRVPVPVTMVVPHVNLDLNPELEDDLSSDYGSASESDEDED
uniref:Mediator of RNA polymerase II transcription subunit 4 n=1 Tax=Physcomitrium patens TaxID=3218 RepID=A0A7I4ALA5_PHYPA